MRAAALLGLLVQLGCYEVPHPEPADSVMSISAPNGVYPADGRTIVTVTIHLDSTTAIGTPVQLTTSSGVLNFAADPATPDARKLTLKYGGSGDLSTPLQVGTSPGPLLLSASAGAINTSTAISLAASTPASIAVSLDRTSVPADGLTPVNVAIQLTTSGPGSHVSAGTRVSLAVCCSDGSAQPTVCATPPLLQLPSTASTDSGDVISARAVPVVAHAGVDGGAPQSEDLFIVVDTSTTASCTAASGPGHQAGRVTVVPL